MASRKMETNWEEVFSRPLLERERCLLTELIQALHDKEINTNMEDRLIWIHDTAGNFSVKHLSSLLVQTNADCVEFKFDRLWKIKVPPKVRYFIWLVSIDRIPSKEFLIKRGVVISEELRGCPWCGLGIEFSFHLLFACRFAASFWQVIFS
ncbi:hypothetical protein GQ457_02G038900 [Hibiscus cannabinus]